LAKIYTIVRNNAEITAFKAVFSMKPHRSKLMASILGKRICTLIDCLEIFIRNYALWLLRLQID